MNYKRAVPDVRGVGRVCRQEEIGVLDLKGVIGSDVDRAVLAAEVADLACLRMPLVARRLGTAAVGIEMSAGQLAVCALGDGVLVDVVRCTTSATYVRWDGR